MGEDITSRHMTGSVASTAAVTRSPSFIGLSADSVVR